MRLIDEEEMRATYGTVAEILEGERLMEERKRKRLEKALESLSKLFAIQERWYSVAKKYDYLKCA